MQDALNAVGEIFRSVPVRVRRWIYGLVGLVIVVDGIFDFLGDDWGPKVLATFGVLTALMALANTSKPVDPVEPGVDEHYPGEFA